MKVIVIDVTKRAIRTEDIPNHQEDGGRALRALVGGYIEIVPVRWPGGHTLFVDEEGMFKPQRMFFRLKGLERPFAGNGVLTGPEEYDDEGEYTGTADVTLTPAQIARVVTFVTRAQADAWATATAYEPESTLTTDDGKTTVLATRGQVWGSMPKPETEE